LTSDNELKLEKEAYRLRDQLINKIEGKILGPVNAPIYRIRKKFRNRLLIRSKKSAKVQSLLANALKNYKLSPGIKLTVDVDPITFN
jgi:primosomal protein N' (replication factor Y)